MSRAPIYSHQRGPKEGHEDEEEDDEEEGAGARA
jgi:hypothetical protein